MMLRDGKASLINCLIVIGGAGVALLLLSLAISQKALPAVVLAGFLGSILFFSATGNPRLASLWGLVLTLPLDMAKRFLVNPHMGGASSVRFDLCDFFLVILIYYLLRDFFRGRRFWYVPLPVYPYLLMMAAGAISLVIGPFRTLAFLELAHMGKLVVLLLVVVNEVFRIRRLEHLIGAMMLSVIIQASIAIIQSRVGHPIGLQFIGEVGQEVTDLLSASTLATGQGVFRVSALLGHPNLFATFIGTQIPFALAILFTGARTWLKVLCTLALALGGIALVFTLSRTGWIIGAVGFTGVMVASFFHPELRSRFLFGRVVLLALLIIMGIIFSGPIMTRIFKSDEGAVDVRFELLEIAGRMIKDKPILGCGFNTFVFRMQPYSGYRTENDFRLYLGMDTPVVHNIYALYFAEAGIFGIVTLLLWIFTVLYCCVRNLQSLDGFIFALGLAGLFAVFGFMLDWLASFSLRHAPMSRCIMLILAVICIARLYNRLSIGSDPPAEGGPDLAKPGNSSR